VFIEADFVNPSTGSTESLFAGVVDENGDVLIGSRFDRILKFSNDGTFLNVFAETPNPNFFAVGSDGLIYASNGSALGNAAQRRLNIFDSNGGIFKSIITPFEVVGIAVCD
jgi:hypothetical protein